MEGIREEEGAVEEKEEWIIQSATGIKAIAANRNFSFIVQDFCW